MVDEDVLKPIKFFAYSLIVVGLLSLFSVPVPTKMETGTDYFIIFCYTLSFIHFVIAAGILARKKWGFYLFKYYLYFLRPQWPLFSVVAKNMLEHIEKNNIEQLFTRRILTIK